ncbi:MAG: helix-turn-helix domain-containing protein [Sphaerochaeta sp.]|nr:helix-turn-helix domain-containing protein [Sphaerochaeta sp.]
METEAVLTIKEAAERAKVGTQKIHRDIRKGHLKAFKVGWVWLINEGDLIDYITSGANIENKN